MFPFGQARQSAATNQARAILGVGAPMLVGVYLRKDPAILIPAHGDRARITAAILNPSIAPESPGHAQTLTPGTIAHRIVWNDIDGRVEMHLESLRSAASGRSLRLPLTSAAVPANAQHRAEAGVAMQ